MNVIINNVFSVGMDDGKIIMMPEENFELLIKKHPWLLNKKGFFVISEGQMCSGEILGICFDIDIAKNQCLNKRGQKVTYYCNVRNQMYYGKDKDKPKFNKEVRRT